MATPYSNYTLPQLYKLLTDTLGMGDIARAAGIAENIGNISGIEPDAVVQRAMRDVEGRSLPSLSQQALTAARYAQNTNALQDPLRGFGDRLQDIEAQMAGIADTSLTAPDDQLEQLIAQIDLPADVAQSSALPDDQLEQLLAQFEMPELSSVAPPAPAPIANPVTQDIPTEALMLNLGNMPQVDANGQFGFDIASVTPPSPTFGKAGTPAPSIAAGDAAISARGAAPSGISQIQWPGAQEAHNARKLTKSKGGLNALNASSVQSPVDFDRSLSQALAQAQSSQGGFERPVSTQFGEQIRMTNLMQQPSVGATEDLLSSLQGGSAPLSHAYAQSGAQSVPPRISTESVQAAMPSPKRPSKAVRNWRPVGSAANAPSTDGLIDELSEAAGTTPKRPITFGKKSAPAPDLSNSGLKGLHSTLTGGGANSISSGTLGSTANVANDMGKASASQGGLGGLFGNLGKKNTLAKPAGGQSPNIGYTKGKGLSAFGKNLGTYASIANTGINALGILQGFADSADEGRRTEDLSADVLTAAASNPMSTYGLTTDQLKTLGDVRSGRFDASADVSDLDFGGALSGALSGGLVGLAGGIPGVIAGALSGGAKGAVGGLSQAKARKNAELEALYQALSQSNTDYQNAMRSRALERYF